MVALHGQCQRGVGVKVGCICVVCMWGGGCAGALQGWLGGHIAAGSYGRVFRGGYFGNKVRVARGSANFGCVCVASASGVWVVECMWMLCLGGGACVQGRLLWQQGKSCLR
jgi:Na+/glutamate symporter